MNVSSFLTPIIVKLGKRKRKALRSLTRQAGPLTEEVEATVEQVRAQLGAETQERVLVPIVVVYKRKTKKRDRVLRWLG